MKRPKLSNIIYYSIYYYLYIYISCSFINVLPFFDKSSVTLYMRGIEK